MIIASLFAFAFVLLTRQQSCDYSVIGVLTPQLPLIREHYVRLRNYCVQGTETL